MKTETPSEQMKCSPLPWKVSTNVGGPDDQPAFPSIVDSSNEPHGADIVAMPLGDSETVKANAAHIIHCVNNFEDLRKALEEIEEYWNGCYGDAANDACDHNTRVARAALAALERSKGGG